MRPSSRAKGWPSLTLGLLLALGAGALWLMLLGLCLTVWSAYTAPQSWERLHVAQSGEVLVQVFRDGDVTFRTPAGEPVAEGPTGVAGASLPPANPKADPHHIPWTTRVWGYLIDHPRRERWYLIHDGHPQGRAYFVGYDRTTKSGIGYLGSHGYMATLPDDAARFVVAADLLSQGWATAGKSSTSGSGSGHPDHGPLYLLSSGKVFLIRFQDRTVRPLDISSPITSIAMLTEYETRGSDNGSVTAVAARPVFRTADELLYGQRSDDEQPPPPLVIPAPLRELNLTVYRLSDGRQVLTSGLPGSRGVLVSWADAAGNITREETIQLGGNRPTAPSGRDYWLTAAMGPATLWVALAEFVFTAPINDATTGKPLGRLEGIRQTLAVGWPPLAAVTLVSTALAIWVFRRQRRLGESCAAAWAGLVLVFGLFGWAAYLLHRNWPARERCPHCGQEVPRNHAVCIACHAAFAPPSSLGIELYA